MFASSTNNERASALTTVSSHTLQSGIFYTALVIVHAALEKSMSREKPCEDMKRNQIQAWLLLSGIVLLCSMKCLVCWKEVQHGHYKYKSTVSRWRSGEEASSRCRASGWIRLVWKIRGAALVAMCLPLASHQVLGVHKEVGKEGLQIISHEMYWSCSESAALHTFSSTTFSRYEYMLFHWSSTLVSVPSSPWTDLRHTASLVLAVLYLSSSPNVIHCSVRQVHCCNNAAPFNSLLRTLASFCNTKTSVIN